jgi:hypothetical protein
MGHKVTKPSQRKYWVARTPSDDIIHVGFLEPNQELVTPQPTLNLHNFRVDQIDEIAAFTGEPPAYNYRYDEFNKKWEFKNRDAQYLPIPKSIGPEFSSGLYFCNRNTGGRLFAEVIEHPDGVSKSLLKIETSADFHFGTQIDTSTLVSALNTAVDEGEFEQSQIGPYIAELNANVSNIVPTSGALPEAWRDNIITYSQADRLGYFPEEEGV